MDPISIWLVALDALQLPPGCSVLDLAPGGDDSLLHALSQRDPAASVVALGPARLGSGLQLRERLGPGPFHLIALRHALDDIVQAAIARHEGIDSASLTAASREALLRALRAYWRVGDLEAIVLPHVVETAAACADALAPSGCLLFTHQVLNSDLRLGHPLDLYTDYIPLARRWLAAAPLPLLETPLDGFDPHWWLCLRRM